MGLQRPKSIKKGSGSLYAPTLHFLAAGPLFVPSAVWILPKGVPRNLTSDLPPCPAAWTPVCAESGLDPPKRGPVTWLQIFASGSTFSAALPHEDAVPVLVPCSACGRCTLCSWRPLPFVRTSAEHALCAAGDPLLFVPTSAEHALHTRVA